MEFEKINEDYLVEKVKSLMTYSLHDEYISQFRRMMTIEQFRSPELKVRGTRQIVL